MQLAQIRQWQWMLLSLIVGALIGYVRQQAAGDLAGEYGECINGQTRFEQALLSVEQGRARFTDITVHARTVPDGHGGTKRMHVVSGLYFNGQYEQKGGRLLARWEPAFFLADIPYKPATDLAAMGKPQLAQKYQAIEQPAVVNFLDLLSVNYTYAWWQGMGMGQWTLGSFIVIGVIWPIILNLLVFGTWRRPREEPGIDLSKVEAHSKPAPVAAIDEDDRAQLQALEAELESKIRASQPPASAATQTPVPVRQLESAPLQVVATAQQSDREFGAKADDFYPTERKKQRR